MAGLVDRAYAVVVRDRVDDPAAHLPADAASRVPANGLRILASLTLQKVGDVVVDAKTVLAWLFAALGAPAALVGLLVPVRESGSLLPQALLVPLVRRAPRRSAIWAAGQVGMTLATAAMAAVVALLDGTAAATGVLVALGAFALSRSLSSIAVKDVLGRTLPKGERGQVTGFASVTSGAVAITFGLAVRVLGGTDVDPSTFVALLAGGAVAFLLARALLARLREPTGEHDEALRLERVGSALSLLGEDRPFRRFVLARTLLLVSALSPPYVVALATASGGASLSGLGPFVIAQGVASLVGGRAWGRLADRSSRLVMVVAAGSAAGVVLLFVAALQVDDLAGADLLYPVTYFVLALIHTGTRVGRSTYVVDLAEGNRRTDYVAVSNTAMGVLLLVVGAGVAGIASAGEQAALVALAALGAAAVPVGLGLPEVSRGR